MEKEKIIAVVVTFNRKKLLAECLNALLAQSVNNLDILVIDNASTDGTKEYISNIVSKNENVIYCNTNSNLGGSGGFSYGIKKAVQMNEYKYVWIMDDDTIPNQNALEKLLDAKDFLQDDFGFLASSVLWTDNSYCKMNRVTIKLPDWHDEYEKLENGLLMLERATFVSLLIKVDVIRDVGIPIKEFFIWGDDQEYTDRISKKYNCYFVVASKVVHKMKENNGSSLLIDNPDRIKRYRYAFRNDFYVAKRNGKKATILYVLRCLLLFFNIILKSPSKKFSRIVSLTIGLAKGIFFNPKIEYIE